MRLGVVGSRDFTPLGRVGQVLTDVQVQAALDNNPLDSVVSGGARGVDRAGEEWAERNGLTVISFRPVNLDPDSQRGWGIVRKTLVDGRWTQHVLHERYPSFAAAAFVRNTYIVEWASDVVAFWDGRSSGTRDSVRKAEAQHKLLDLVTQRSIRVVSERS